MKCPVCGAELVLTTTGHQRLIAGEYVEDIHIELYCPECEWNNKPPDDDIEIGVPV